jgi:DinB superfamily
MDFWLQRAFDEIDSATAGLSPQQMDWRPAEGKWCTAQILEHLSNTFSSTITALKKVEAAGRPAGSRPGFYQSLATFVVGDLGYFPHGRPAPAWTIPHGAPAEQVAKDIREHLRAMDAILVGLERQFGPRVKVANHPIVGPFSVTDWRKFHYRHTHHHMKQVRAIRALLVKPSAKGAAEG